MVKVVLWSTLQAAADNQSQVEVEARDVRELLDRLAATYPGLKPQIDRGVSVSIDGLIYANTLTAKIAPDSEVVLLPRLVGG
ncbi:MAG TPA: MoaD/ThiS family protein [Kiloniellaceae bacterium]|nr:MoaD/ThiS family protein [Kiloniellaceae bacterium]